MAFFPKFTRKHMLPPYQTSYRAKWTSYPTFDDSKIFWGGGYHLFPAKAWVRSSDEKRTGENGSVDVECSANGSIRLKTENANRIENGMISVELYLEPGARQLVPPNYAEIFKTFPSGVKLQTGSLRQLGLAPSLTDALDIRTLLKSQVWGGAVGTASTLAFTRDRGRVLTGTIAGLAGGTLFECGRAIWHNHQYVKRVENYASRDTKKPQKKFTQFSNISSEVAVLKGSASPQMKGSTFPTLLVGSDGLYGSVIEFPSER